MHNFIIINNNNNSKNKRKEQFSQILDNDDTYGSCVTAMKLYNFIALIWSNGLGFIWLHILAIACHLVHI